MNGKRISRRYFIMGTGAAAATTAFINPRWSHSASANEKLNIASIGVGGRGKGHTQWAAENENLVAMCDVDDERAADMYNAHPDVPKYRDFRKMLEQKDIDAVFVSTPDHVHAAAALAALELGKHVYCEKPLTYSIAEARALTKASKRYYGKTQMGNQGHSGHGVREMCEMLWSGVIGDVKEVHCWTDRPLWPQGIAEALPAQEVPATLDWDLWLGPAPVREYNKEYLPFNWRGWWDFGCGALGDMGCHIMDASFWALHLTAPTAVEVVEQEGNNTQTGPNKSHLKLDFPARVVDGKEWGAVTLHWYDGGALPPRPEGVPEDEKLGDTIFIGEKGAMTCQTYGENPRLLPASKMEGYQKPDPYLPRVPEEDHRADWVRACKNYSYQSASNFGYAGPFTEAVLIGNLALRAGGRIEWDSEKMEVTNNKDANQFVAREYRKGWTL